MKLFHGREFAPDSTARCKTNLDGQLNLTVGKIYQVEDLSKWHVVVVENDKGVIQTYHTDDFGPLRPL